MSETKSVEGDNMTKKLNDSVQVNLRITTNSNQGGRKYMEDTYAIALQRLNQSDKESPISLAYFGIFDGHGGKEAAEFARQSLCQHILEQDDFWKTTSDENERDQLILSAIRKGFLACHNDMWNHVGKWAKTSSGLPSTSGCTASIAFIRENKLYIGHVGDSVIVLGEGETLYKPWSVNRLTRDHKPEDPDELTRIRESGGNVLCKAGVHRVVWNRPKLPTNSTHSYRHRHQHSIITTTTTTTANGTTVEYEQIPFLAVSRALGDLWSLNPTTNLYSVSPEPELTVIKIDPNKHRCLILASDGLWNMITPETAVEIVRNCDLKTEEMILKSEDDDHRPFRNPSHELVQKALTLWRERMLRSDNITCITVMLDPPGPPFSDCIIKKKKEKLTYSISSSTASVCSEDTVDLDHLSPTNSTTITTTPSKTKPLLERKEHILIPISNGPTPVRTPKRPASEDASTLNADNSRRKLIKINQQKENGRTTPSASSNPTESEMISSSPLSSLTTTIPSTSSTETKEDDQELSLSEQSSELAILDNEDLNRKVEQCFRNLSHLEQQSEDQFMDIDQPSLDLLSNETTTDNKKSSDKQENLTKPTKLRRTRSVSTTTTTTTNSINNLTESKMNSTRRRKSTNSNDLIANSEKKSKIKSPSTNRVKRVLARSHKPSPSSDSPNNSVVSSTSPSPSLSSQ